ncbi:MAG: hypothetical protein QM539_00050 [Alphaproteobacteria bacterium]|nr:hypothetical protein [Alphaproteobacteria bacterium]
MKKKILFTHLFIFIVSYNAFSTLNKLPIHLNTNIKLSYTYNIELAGINRTPNMLSKFSTNNYTDKIIFTTKFLHHFEIMNAIQHQSTLHIINTLQVQYNSQTNKLFTIKPIKHNLNIPDFLSVHFDTIKTINKDAFLQYPYDALSPPQNFITPNSKFSDMLRQGKHLTWYGIGTMTIGVIASILFIKYKIPGYLSPLFIPPPFVTGISLISVGQALIHKAKKYKNH